MQFFALTIMFFMLHGEPSLGAKYFTDRNTCEKAEGEILTRALHDKLVMGVIVIDECKAIGTKAIKG